MIMKDSRKQGDWKSRKAAAADLGCSLPTFDMIRPRLSASDQRKGRGNSIEFRMPAVIAAWKDYNVEQRDPLMAGPVDDSPGLERYRNAKARLAEMDVAERDNELVRRGVILDALNGGVFAL